MAEVAAGATTAAAAAGVAAENLAGLHSRAVVVAAGRHTSSRVLRA